MAEAFGHDLDRHARFEQQGGVGVAEVVQPEHNVVVRPVLCFFGATWPGLFPNKPIRVGDALVTCPRDLAKRVAEDGPLSAQQFQQFQQFGRRLAARLPPA